MQCHNRQQRVQEGESEDSLGTALIKAIGEGIPWAPIYIRKFQKAGCKHCGSATVRNRAFVAFCGHLGWLDILSTDEDWGESPQVEGEWKLHSHAAHILASWVQLEIGYFFHFQGVPDIIISLSWQCFGVIIRCHGGFKLTPTTLENNFWVIRIW